jgi:hypothetical protein
MSKEDLKKELPFKENEIEFLECLQQSGEIRPEL